MQMCNFFVSVSLDDFLLSAPWYHFFITRHLPFILSLKGNFFTVFYVFNFYSTFHILYISHFYLFFNSISYLFFIDTCAVDGKLFAAGFTVISRNALLCGGSNEISFDGAYACVEINF